MFCNRWSILTLSTALGQCPGSRHPVVCCGHKSSLIQSFLAIFWQSLFTEVCEVVRRMQTCRLLGQNLFTVRLTGNWEVIYFRRISAAALCLWVVLDVSTANAVLVFLHKDLLTAQTSTAQLPVLIIGLCKNHNYCMHSYILDQWSLTWGSWRCFRGVTNCVGLNREVFLFYNFN